MSLSVPNPRSLGPRRWCALGAASLAVLVVGLDGTVLSVALPTLAKDLHAHWWGWVFLMNVPITVLGLLVASVLVPESLAARPPGLDPAGAATSVAGLLAMTYGLIEAGQHGW